MTDDDRKTTLADGVTPDYLGPIIDRAVIESYAEHLGTEWLVVCANGHRDYMRLDGVNDPSFTDCPTCGAPRRGERLPPVDDRAER